MKTRRFEAAAGQKAPVAVHVEHVDGNGQPADPTSTTAHLAIVPMGTTPTTWTAATWTTDYSTSPDWHEAQVVASKVGGGGAIELASGSYDVWCRITDGSTVIPAVAYRLVVP